MSPKFASFQRHLPLSAVLLAALLAAVVLSGCSSYRTFNSLHWAKEAYKEGKRAQQDAEQRRRTGGISATAAEERQTQILGQEQFEDAARKCLFFLSQSSEGRRTDDVLLLMGQSFFELRRFVQARNSLQTLIDTQRKSKLRDDAIYYLVRVELEEGDIGRAELGIERLIEEHSGSRFRPLAQYYLAIRLFEDQQYPRALEVFFGVRDNYGDFERRGEVLAYISRIYFETGEFEQALEGYQRLREKGQDDPQKREGLIGMARCKSRMDQHEQALALYEEALATARFIEERAEARVGIDVEYTYLGRHNQALKGFEQIIFDNPRSRFSAAAWYELGLLYKDFHEHAGLDSIVLDSVAMPHFQLNSKRIEQFKGLSQHMTALQLAEMCFTKVRGDDPNSELVPAAQMQIDEVRTLSNIFEQMEASDSSSSRDALARLQFLLAEYYETAGELEKARAGYERVLFEYPRTIWVPKATLNVANLSAALGDSARSRQALELVVGNFPETRYADQARRELGLPVPERTDGFYLDELAAYSPPRIQRAAAGAGPAGAGAALGTGRGAIGQESWLQMRRRIWQVRAAGGGA